MTTPLFSDKVAEIFVKVDDFCNVFEYEFKKHSLPASSTLKKRNRKATLSDCEIITILPCLSWRAVQELQTLLLSVYICSFKRLLSQCSFLQSLYRAPVTGVLCHLCCSCITAGGVNARVLVL